MPGVGENPRVPFDATRLDSDENLQPGDILPNRCQVAASLFPVGQRANSHSWRYCVGNLKSHPADSSCGTIHYDASTVAGMSGCAVAARVRGQHVVVGIHLGTWACQEGHLNVAAGYHALQRLRRACGNAKTLSSPAALEYLRRKVRREVYCGKTESPLPSELQSTISDSDYEDEEILVQAKSG